MTVPLQRIASLKLVLDTPKGRGVFAAERLEAGTVVDTAPVIVLSRDDCNRVQDTDLNNYSYNWPKRCTRTGKIVRHQAIVLGLGSMFNHSSLRQNIGWKRSLDARDIQEGEELLISYGSHLTFVDVEAAELAQKEQEQEGDGTDVLSRIEV